MSKISKVQVEEVIALYTNNHSILETAKTVGISTVKVRKILITEGLWESNTSVKIGELLKLGMTTEEIAAALYMSIKNVQAYMPYERGMYGNEDMTKEALRSDKYRRRMRKAASMQISNTPEIKKSSERMEEMEDQKVRESKQVKPERQKVLKLHLELDMKYVREEEMRILQKYGSVNQTISRDILVPEDITLHALNYAILRMFGWQNSHLHSYSLPEDVFKELTKNQFRIWSKMAGIYFRFPTENYEDIYWDDNYKEGESIKSWMKKKYTGPYTYKGLGEHYLLNQMEVAEMFERWDEITVHEFRPRTEKQIKPYCVKLKEATIDQVVHSFADVNCEEMIERLPLTDVLCLKGSQEFNYAKIREYIDEKTMGRSIHDAVAEYSYRPFGSFKQERKFLEEYNIQAFPITEQLIYRYDYGDGWQVFITLEDIFEQDDMMIWKGKKETVEKEEIELLEEVIAKHRPRCIQKDGIELVDDVGGIMGFCRMLQTIYDADIDNEQQMEERDSMLDWAEMMGWTGRRISPKQTL